MNFALGGKRHRVYPEVTEGDQVKERGKGHFLKRTQFHWLKEIFSKTNIVKKLGQNHYHVNGRPSPPLRHELLKV